MNAAPTRRYKVLFVDDEVMALKYFSQTLDDSMVVLTAESVDAAIAILDAEHQHIGVLVTDQRMPGKQGVELLHYARTHYPQITRILATAYADLSDAIAAVNSGEIFRYIKKPWDGDQLILDIKMAMDIFELTQERDELISAKMSVYQQMVLLGRVKDLVLMAAALRAQLPAAGAAIRSYLDHAHQALQTGDQRFSLAIDQLDLGRNHVLETQRSTALIAELMRPDVAQASMPTLPTLPWPAHPAHRRMVEALWACYETPPSCVVEGQSVSIKGAPRQGLQPLWDALTASAAMDLSHAAHGLRLYLWAAECGLTVSLQKADQTELSVTLSPAAAKQQDIDTEWLDDLFHQFSN